MTLFQKIKQIYPELVNEDFLETIKLQNDLDEWGDYIKEWNHPTLVQPTDEELAALTARIEALEATP